MILVLKFIFWATFLLSPLYVLYLRALSMIELTYEPKPRPLGKKALASVVVSCSKYGFTTDEIHADRYRDLFSSTYVRVAMYRTAVWCTKALFIYLPLMVAFLLMLFTLAVSILTTF